MAALAAPAWATEGIETFTTTASTSAAGGHPNIETNIVLENPGSPEAAKDVIVNTPEGVFGNPRSVVAVHLAAIRPRAVPVGLASGPDHDPRQQRRQSELPTWNGADLHDAARSGDDRRLCAFIVPTLNIPINIPITARTGGDYGLRFTVADITQLTPFASAHLTFWGFPGAAENNINRFPKGTLGEPAGCPGLADTSCLGGPLESHIPIQPLTDNPSLCTGNALPTTLEVRTYQDLEHVSTANSSFPDRRPNANARPSSRCSTEVRPATRPTRPRVSTSTSKTRSSSALRSRPPT